MKRGKPEKPSHGQDEEPKPKAGLFDHRAIDDVIHSRIRLAAMAILVSFEEADFIFLREQVGTTDGNLITHMHRLLEAGYVQMEKRVANGRPSTVYRLTPAGRNAFEVYVERLGKLLPR